MKEFKVAATQQARAEDGEAELEPLPFKIGDDVFTANPPTPAQFALFITTQSENADTATSIAGVIDFFNGMLDDEDRMLFRRRLLNRKDPLDLETVLEVIEWLAEEWYGRPTGSSSASTPSRKQVGTRSKAKQPSVA